MSAGPPPWRTAACAVAGWALSCNTAGSDWMAQPLDGEHSAAALAVPSVAPTASTRPAARRVSRTLVLGEHSVGAEEEPPAPFTNSPAIAAKLARGGSVLGTFKNTYYDFPSEGDFDGEPTALMNGACKPIVQVPRGFYESVCVQGSGTLRSGSTVSFARRDCECAAECPRTGQRICFDLLDRAAFPWGRGAMGKAITPLLTVAVDSSVVPLGTALYIPEYDGIPRTLAGDVTHDGCFRAEDRGLAVKGKHVDVFTGHRDMTQLWNRLVPSHRGVTLVLDSPRCRAR